MKCTGDKTWEDSVEGAVHGLAAASGTLLVSTDCGAIYAYRAQTSVVSNELGPGEVSGR